MCNIQSCFIRTTFRLRIVSLIGAGLLIGTALIVIIPEGIHMYYNAIVSTDIVNEGHVEHEGHHDKHDAHHNHDSNADHWQMGASMAAGYALMLIIDRVSGNVGHAHASNSGLPDNTKDR